MVTGASGGIGRGIALRRRGDGGKGEGRDRGRPAGAAVPAGSSRPARGEALPG